MGRLGVLEDIEGGGLMGLMFLRVLVPAGSPGWSQINGQ